MRSDVSSRALCTSGSNAGQVGTGRVVTALRSDVSAWIRVGGASSASRASRASASSTSAGARSSSESTRALAWLVNRTDLLVAGLRDHALCEALTNVTWRSADAQLACYSANGTRYVRHMDNVCSANGVGKQCNGRRLTLVYYLNERSADPSHGALRLFLPGPPSSSPLMDLEPLLDRLVVFFSDERVPHAVLPTGPAQERSAVTLWYFDHAELERASAQRTDSDEGKPPSMPSLSAVPSRGDVCSDEEE